MNSLAELNSASAELITFTDLRTPGPVFDRPIAESQTVNVNQNDDHAVANALNIIDIIRPADAYITYTIDATSHAGAVIEWPTVPTGCTVTNPFPGIYTISGIDSVATWDIIKNPTFYPDSFFIGVFSYTVTIDWYPSNSITWTVNVTINDIDNLSTASDFYFDASQTGLITGNPTVIDNYSTTWTVRVTPSNTDYITTLSSAGSGGTSSFNSTTKVLTISGTKTQVNARLNAITYVTSASATTDFTFSYYAINDTTNEGDVKVQQWDSTRYISATRANDTYTLNTLTSITGGPLITDTGASGTGAYTLRVTPTVTGSINTMTSTGRLDWGVVDEFNNPDPDPLDQFGVVAFSGDNRVMVVGSGQDDTTTARQNDQRGAVYVFYSSDSTWDQGTVPYGVIEGSSVNQFLGSEVATNSDGTTIVVRINDQNLAGSSGGGYGYGKYRIYTRSGTTLTLQATINPTETESVPLEIYKPVLSNDGNTLAFLLRSATTVTYVLVYNRSGSTWTKQAKLSGQGISGGFGLTNQDLSNDGNTLAVGSYVYDGSGATDTGAVYIFTRSGSTWTQQQIITVGGAGTRLGYYVRLSADGNTLFSTSSGSTAARSYRHTRSGTTWTLANTWTNTFVGPTIVAISKDLSTLINASTQKIYTLSGSTWTQTGSIPSAALAYPLGVFNVSNDASFIIGANPDANSGTGGVIILKQQTVGRSFNATTKELTLTGNKAQINADIDTIQLTPTTGYSSNITLTYEVSTPAGNLDRRTQLITYTA